MKVLLSNKFFHLNGGSERVFFQERDFLLGLGIPVVDFSMQDKRNFESAQAEYFVDNIDYQNAGGLTGKLKQAVKFVHSAEAVKKLEQLIIAEELDIAHLHNIYHQLTPSIINVLKKHGVKVVLTLHDYKLVCPNYIMLNGDAICDACDGRHFWKPLRRHCQGSWMQESLLCAEAYWHKWRGSYDNVDLFLAPSRFMAEQVARRIPADRIRVLPNGIDIAEFEPEYQDDGYALYFGRLSREKGIATLADAHRQVSDAVDLKVVGTGPLAETLKKDYPATEFLGYKQGAELLDIIARAAFVVVPSEWYENCSMVVLETMAMGKPVIGSRIGGIPEQVVDGETGFLFEMGNAEDLAAKMMILAKDRDMRIAFGRNARRRLEECYSLESHCRDLLNIYKNLI